MSHLNVKKSSDRVSEKYMQLMTAKRTTDLASMLIFAPTICVRTQTIKRQGQVTIRIEEDDTDSCSATRVLSTSSYL